MNFLAILKTLVTLLPTIIQAIQALETALPESGQGAKKLEALKTVVQSAYSVANDTSLAFESLWPAISTTVSALVAMFKR